MSADCSKLDQDQAECPQILGSLPNTFSAKLCLVSFSAAGADADTAQRYTHRVATAVRTPLLNMSSPDKGLCQSRESQESGTLLELYSKGGTEDWHHDRRLMSSSLRSHHRQMLLMPASDNLVPSNRVTSCRNLTSST